MHFYLLNILCLYDGRDIIKLIIARSFHEKLAQK